MATIHVDDKTYEVSGANNLLQACLSLGLDIPYFCWHPSLGSIGSCRQCAVKQYANKEDAADGKGKIVMSCMVETSSDLYISIDDEEAKAFRQSVTELLMTNHPHDCPTCEEGGHCHLQDMTYMTGHDRREYRFEKRTHHNQYLGPFIAHEMNRCIACYRCVRFYNDYAGGTDLGVFASSNRVYFGRHEEGVLESEFSGNLTEVCPTGVFTDQTHSEHYTRKWDMQYAPSICQGCSLGCNISAGERYGEIRRIENRYHGDVNQYFLCDRGRFGYDVTDSKSRPEHALFKSGGNINKITTDEAIDMASQVINQAIKADKVVVGIGSSRASVEANYALKTLLGEQRFYAGVSAKEKLLVDRCVDALNDQLIQTPSLRQIEASDCVLILGEDITQTAARLALSVRQAAKNRANDMTKACKTPTWLAEPRDRIGQRELSPIYIVDTHVTRLDDVARVSATATPQEIAEFGQAVAAALTGSDFEDGSQMQRLAKNVANNLSQAKNPLIISGSSLLDVGIVEAARSIAQAMSPVKPNDQQNRAGLFLVAPAANSIGVHLLGGKALDELYHQSVIDVLVVMENDLSYHLTASQLANVLKRTQKLIVIDHYAFDWHAKANIFLPAASFAESDGTCVSAEGRAQRYFQVYEPRYYRPDTQVVESWRWLHAISAHIDHQSPSWVVLDDVIKQIADSEPVLAKIIDAAPNDDYRISGLKIAREPRRYSGRTAMRAPLSVHEPKQPIDQDSALTFSMEGYVGDKTQGALIPFAWAPGWNSPQSWNKFQDEVGGHLKQGDPGVRLFDQPLDIVSLPMDSAGQSYQRTVDQVTLIPLPDLFSSGEMVRHSANLAKRADASFVVVSPKFAQDQGIDEGATVIMLIDDQAIELSARVLAHFPDDAIGYPVTVLPAVNKYDDSVDVKLKPGVQAVGS